MNLFEYISSLYWTLPPIIKVILIFTLTLVMAVAFLAILIFVLKFVRHVKKRKTRKMESRWQGILLATLMETNPEKARDMKAKNIPVLAEMVKKNSFRKKVLRSQLIFLNRQFKGRTHKTIVSIYKGTGLWDQVMAELSKGSWPTKTAALLEMREIGLAPPKPQLVSMMESKHLHLKAEALLAVARFYPEDMLDILQKYPHPVSHWEEVKILNILRDHPPVRMPDFSEGIQSQHHSVKVFCIRMAGYFRQYKSGAFLLESYLNGSESVKLAAVESLRQLALADFCPEFINTYHTQPEVVMVKVLKFLGEFGGAQALPLLKDALTNGSFNEKITAARILKRQYDGGEDYLNHELKHAKGLQMDILRQVLQPAA